MNLVFLILFIAIYLLLNFWGKNSTNSAKTYFLASRKLGIFPLMATLIVSQYGWINGVFEVYMIQGPLAWLILSLPYLIFNTVWIYLGKYLHQHSSLTTPLLFVQSYDRRVGKLGAIFLTIVLIPIMYVHMGAEILEYAFNIPFAIGAALFILLSSVAIFSGGFQKLVWTDVFLFIIIYGGLLAIVSYFYLSPSFSITNPQGSSSSAAASTITSYSDYLGWWLLALIVFIDPSIHQRIWASGSDHQAKKIMTGAILGWIIFDLLIIAIVVYSRNIATTPDVFGILETLPNILQIVFIFMLLSVILSTTNTYFNITYNNIAFDLMDIKTDSNKRHWVSLLVMLLCFLTTVFIFQQNSVVDILFELNPVCISALFFPFISVFIPSIKLPSKAVFWQMLVSAIVCLFFQINPLNWLKFVTPVALGLAASVLYQILFILLWRAQKETKN